MPTKKVTFSRTETLGGNCSATVIGLDDGSILVVDDEFTGHYASLESWENGGDALELTAHAD